MGMDTLKNDLIDWIADTVAMWVAEDGCELTNDLIENAIMEEMDSLTEDMYQYAREGKIQLAAEKMIKEYEEDE